MFLFLLSFPRNVRFIIFCFFQKLKGIHSHRNTLMNWDCFLMGIRFIHLVRFWGKKKKNTLVFRIEAKKSDTTIKGEMMERAGKVGHEGREWLGFLSVFSEMLVLILPQYYNSCFHEELHSLMAEIKPNDLRFFSEKKTKSTNFLWWNVILKTYR